MIESETIELKATFVNDLNKEVIAFANTNGGEIYIGLEDTGKPCGLKNINDKAIHHRHSRWFSTTTCSHTPFFLYNKSCLRKFLKQLLC